MSYYFDIDGTQIIQCSQLFGECKDDKFTVIRCNRCNEYIKMCFQHFICLCVCIKCTDIYCNKCINFNDSSVIICTRCKRNNKLVSLKDIFIDSDTPAINTYILSIRERIMDTILNEMNELKTYDEMRRNKKQYNHLYSIPQQETTKKYYKYKNKYNNLKKIKSNQY